MIKTSSETAVVDGGSGPPIAAGRIRCLLIIASCTQQPMTNHRGSTRVRLNPHARAQGPDCEPCRWLWCGEHPSRSAVGETCSPAGTNNCAHHIQPLERNFTPTVAHAHLQGVCVAKAAHTELLLPSVNSKETSTDTVYVWKLDFQNKTK